MLSHGSPLEFDAADEDYGYLATANGYIINELMQLMSRGAGGVSEVTEAEYEEFLKKKAQTLFDPRSLRNREMVGPAHLGNVKPRQPGAGAAVAVTDIRNGQASTGQAAPQKVDALKVETEFVVPKIGKA